MTTVCRWTWTFVITGALVLTASVALGQSTKQEEPSTHDGIQHHAKQTAGGSQSSAALLKMGMMHAATADADLKALVDDMNMFVGDMKIDLMARVLTLLVERQSTMREQMTAMHQRMLQMMPPMEDLSVQGASGAVMGEVEPGTMCTETPR